MAKSVTIEFNPRWRVSLEGIEGAHVCIWHLCPRLNYESLPWFSMGIKYSKCKECNEEIPSDALEFAQINECFQRI